MTRLAHSGAAMANFASDALITKSGSTDHPIAAAMRALHGLFRQKAPAEIAARARVSDPRVSKYWLARTRDPSADALVNLLRSDAGPAVRDALLAGVDWHERERALLRVIEAEERAAEYRKQAQELRRRRPR